MPTLTISSDALARVLLKASRIARMRSPDGGPLIKCNTLAHEIMDELHNISGTCDCGNDCDYTGQCSECRETAAVHDAGDDEYHRVAEGD